MHRGALALACACWPAIAEAQPARLGESDIRALVSGATIALDTPLGTQLPVSYTPEGKVSGSAGDLAFYLGAARDTGTWWIASGRLCHRWQRWFDGQEQCLVISRQGRTLHWRNQEGRTGTASVAVPAQPVAVAAVGQGMAAASLAPGRMPDGAMRLTPPKPQAPGATDIGAPLATPQQQPRLPETRTAQVTPPAKPLAPLRKVEVPPSRAVDAPRTPQTPARPPLPPPPAAPLFIVANVEAGDVLNVRAGPSAESDVVGGLQPGSDGIAISGTCRESWCPITLDSLNGWVNRRFLAAHTGDVSPERGPAAVTAKLRGLVLRDSPEAPRGCLSKPARALLDQIEARFGPVRLVSTCRPGARIAGTGRPSRHASGNAFDFDAGARKAAVIDWLIANHRAGGTMTYPSMDHIHADIGPHFVSIAGGRRWASWRNGR